MRAADLAVGQRVRWGQAGRDGTVGTVVKVLGRPRVGGGLHAKVRWDTGWTGTVRPDLLEEVADQ